MGIVDILPAKQAVRAASGRRATSVIIIFSTEYGIYRISGKLAAGIIKVFSAECAFTE